MRFPRIRQLNRVQRQRGLTLIEAALVLAIAAVSTSYFVRMQADTSETMRAKGVSEKMVEVFDSANKYIKVNNAALMNIVPAGSSIVIPVGKPDATSSIPTGPSGLPSVQGGGFLSPGFIDRNSYNQRHALIVRNVNVPGIGQRLDAIVTTYGGTKIPDRILTRVAGFLGASGGYVPGTPLSGDSGQIVGSYGGWRSPISSWGSTTPPAVGSVVTTLAFEAGKDGLANYLYRNDIGIPEANRMHTDIDVNGHSLNNVSNIRGSAAFGNTVTLSTNATATGVVRGETGLESGRDLVVAGNASIGIDIWAGRNITASGNVSGLNVNATNNVTAGNTVTGNVVTALSQVNSYGSTWTQNDTTTGRNMTVGNNLNVGAKTTTYDLRTTFLDASALYVYGIRGLSPGHYVTLDSLLPKQVAMYSYFATEGSWVPKPTCPAGSIPRIMAYRQQDSTSGMAVVSVVAIGPASGTADIVNSLYAYDVSPYAWGVAWGGMPASPSAPRSAIVQTYCAFE